MQDMTNLDWAFIALICTVTSAASVYWLASWRPMTGSEVTLSGGPGTRGPVFLFEGSDLIDASVEARSYVDMDRDGFDWTRLYEALSAKYPSFPQSPEEVRAQKSLTIPADDEGGQDVVFCEWIDGITRVHLRGQEDQDQRAPAATKEPEAQRLAMVQAPYPVWMVDLNNTLCWSNAAYDALRMKAGIERADLTVPMFPLVFGKGPENKKTRSSIAIEGCDNKLWYDVSVVGKETGYLCYAVDVNAVVDAEIAQRNFVQTLAKTFAQLSIGLAIFDRNRQLALFNPALIDLTALPADFLSARPNLLSFFDRLRDQRMMPEPKNYGSWRHQMADLVAAATDGRYQETWTLPSGAVYSVSGRPHPDGAVAFLFEDITAEITLTRRFRTDLEINQSVLDQLDDAIVVFSESGGLSFSNQAYRKLWKVEPEASFVQVSVLDATRTWQDQCRATPVLGEVREFVALRENRAEWWGEIQLNAGQHLSCCVFPIGHGATMVVFSRISPSELPETMRRSYAALAHAGDV